MFEYECVCERAEELVCSRMYVIIYSWVKWKKIVGPYGGKLSVGFGAASVGGKIRKWKMVTEILSRLQE